MIEWTHLGELLSDDENARSIHYRIARRLLEAEGFIVEHRYATRLFKIKGADKRVNLFKIKYSELFGNLKIYTNKEYDNIILGVACDDT